MTIVRHPSPEGMVKVNLPDPAYRNRGYKLEIISLEALEVLREEGPETGKTAKGPLPQVLMITPNDGREWPVHMFEIDAYLAKGYTFA